MPTVIYYSNNILDEGIQYYCLKNLEQAARFHSEIITVSWEPLPLEVGTRRIVTGQKEMSHKSIYEQILMGLEYVSPVETVALAEHDVLYHLNHFEMGCYQSRKEPKKFCYSSNVVHLTKEGFAKAQPVPFLSTLVARADVLAEGIRRKLVELETTGQIQWAEPTAPEGPAFFASSIEIIDIRHDTNFTIPYLNNNYYERSPYWGLANDIWKRIDDSRPTIEMG